MRVLSIRPGMNMEGASGTGPKYWSTTFDQIEDADTDINLIRAKLGLEPSAEPHVMVIIDTHAAREIVPTQTFVPTFERLRAFTGRELPLDFPAEQLARMMTGDFQAEYARHYRAAKKTGYFKKAETPRQFQRYLRKQGLNETERSLMASRFEMQRKIGNNEHYMGNGLTRNLVEGVENQFGAVETFNFQTVKASLRKFGDAIDIIDLTEITPQ